MFLSFEKKRQRQAHSAQLPPVCSCQPVPTTAHSSAQGLSDHCSGDPCQEPQSTRLPGPGNLAGSWTQEEMEGQEQLRRQLLTRTGASSSDSNRGQHFGTTTGSSDSSSLPHHQQHHQVVVEEGQVMLVLSSADGSRSHGTPGNSTAQRQLSSSLPLSVGSVAAQVSMPEGPQLSVASSSDGRPSAVQSTLGGTSTMSHQVECSSAATGPRRGSFQRKFRSLFGGKDSSKKTVQNSVDGNLNVQEQLSETVRELSKSTPALNQEPRGHHQSLYLSAASTRTLDRTCATLPPLSRLHHHHQSSAAIEDTAAMASGYLRDDCSQWFSQSSRQRPVSMAAATLPPSHGVSFSSSQLNVKVPRIASSHSSHNLVGNLQEKVHSKDAIVQESATQVKDFYQQHHQLPPSSRMDYRTTTSSEEETVLAPDESYVVVVDQLQPTYARSQKYLTVRSQEQQQNCVPDHGERCATDQDDEPNGRVSVSSGPRPEALMYHDKSLASAIPERVGSAASQGTYRESSSESGRGTLRSDKKSVNGGVGNEMTSQDATSLDSDRSGSAKNCDQGPGLSSNSNFGVVEKVQQDLQRILDDNSQHKTMFYQQSRNRNPMPVVIESESWVSDSSTTCQRTAVSCAQKNTTKAAKAGAGMSSTGPDRVGFNKGGLPGKQGVTSQDGLKNKTPSAAAAAAAGVVGGTGDKKKSLVLSKEKGATKLSYSRERSQKAAKQHHPLEVTKRHGGPPTVSSSLSKTKAWLEGSDIASTTTCNDFGEDDRADLTSECPTLDTEACWYQEEAASAVDTTMQIKKLHDMYGEILKGITSKLNGNNKKAANSRGGKGRPSTGALGLSRKKFHGSMSTVTSATSRGTFGDNHRQPYSRRQTTTARGDDASSSSSRLKRLENHVVTLARSVAHLSSEIRGNHQVVQELAATRTELERMKDQMKSYQGMFESYAKARHAANEQQSLPRSRRVMLQPVLDMASPGKQADKLTKFLGDEPPLLSHFLQKLGYEKYTKIFDSEKIGMNELCYLSEEKLQKLGLPMGPRIRLMQEIQKLQMNRINRGKYNYYIV